MRTILTKLARSAQRESGQTMAEYAVVLAVVAIGIFVALGALSGAISGAPRHGHGRDLDPVPPRAAWPASSCSTREAPDRRLSLFSGRAYSRDARRAPPHVPQPARRRGARAHGRRDPARRRGRPARAGPGRDGDRAARAPAARRVVPRPLQRAARLHRAARRWPASRSSATTSTTTSADCRRRTACSRSTTRAPACRRP